MRSGIILLFFGSDQWIWSTSEAFYKSSAQKYSLSFSFTEHQTQTLEPEYAWLLSNLSCVWVTEGLIRKGRFLRCKLRGSVRPVVLNLFPTVSYERSTLHRCGFSSYTRAQWFCMIFYWLMKQSCQQSPPRLQRGSRPINQRHTDATVCLFVCMQVFFCSESTRVSVEIMSPLTVLNKGMWHLLLRNQACFSRNVWE